MKKKILDIIVFIEIFVILIIPLLLFNWTQGSVSTSENRTLAAFPTFFDENGKLRHDLASQFNSWFNDNIGLRDQLICLCNTVKYNVFNQSTSSKVEFGEDGWLYYTPDHNLDIAKNSYPNFTTEDLENYCERLVAINESLQRQGIEFVLLLPPSKVSIYPEYIQSSECKPAATPVDILSDYLESNSNVKVIRLKDALLEAKGDTNELLYFKTDTHWNYYGRYVGYKKIVSDLRNWGIINSGPIEVKFSDEYSYAGDLSNMLGPIRLSGEHYSEDLYKSSMLLNDNAQEITDGETYEEFSNMVISKGVSRYSMWINETCDDESQLLLFGDSMIGSCIINYIANNFSNTAFVWSYNVDNEIIDLINPDVVILDISERGLCSVLPSIGQDYYMGQ